MSNGYRRKADTNLLNQQTVKTCDVHLTDSKQNHKNDRTYWDVVDSTVNTLLLSLFNTS